MSDDFIFHETDLKVDEIPINNSQIDRISIYPVVDGQIGLEAKEPESSIKRNSFGKRILDAPPETISWWNFEGTVGDDIGRADCFVLESFLPTATPAPTVAAVAPIPAAVATPFPP